MTLGGGIGHLMRRFGLTIDNLISCDLITADAEFVTASTDEHPDLFSGLRGGGGNFGVVTSFDCRLHPLDPIVLAGVLAWPMAEASAVLRFFRDFVTDAPDELGIMANLRLTSSPHGSRTTPSASDTRRGRERRGRRCDRSLRASTSTSCPRTSADVQAAYGDRKYVN